MEFDIDWFLIGFAVGVVGVTLVDLLFILGEWLINKKARFHKIGSCDKCREEIANNEKEVLITCPKCGNEIKLPRAVGRGDVRCICDFEIGVDIHFLGQ